MDISMPKEGPWVMGEVVISVERAWVQSKIFKMDFKKEVALYIVHGILHLLGYKDDQDHLAKKMWERQNFILDQSYRGI
jgi:probable rRNA maturation factor